MATCPGLGRGVPLSLGLGAKFNQAGSRRSPETRPARRHRSVASSWARTPAATVRWAVRPPRARKPGIRASSHPQAAPGMSPTLSGSPSLPPRSHEEGKTSLPGEQTKLSSKEKHRNYCSSETGNSVSFGECVLINNTQGVSRSGLFEIRPWRAALRARPGVPCPQHFCLGATCHPAELGTG